MEGPHAGLFLGFVVVVAEEVEDAVDDKKRGFMFGRVASFCGLAEGLGKADYNVAEVRRIVGRSREFGEEIVWSWKVVIALPWAGMFRREGKNVGDLVFAAKSGIQGAYCGVVAEGEG